jgi:tetracycline repressor-like protein
MLRQRAKSLSSPRAHWLLSELERRGGTPAERLLAIFDAFDGWFRRPGFEGCSFINVLLEHGEPGHPVREAAVRHLADIRGFIAKLASDAGVVESEEFARQWQILLKGSIIAAAEGDRDAAPPGKESGDAAPRRQNRRCRRLRIW